METPGWYTIRDIRALLKGYFLPTSTSYWLHRERVETRVVEGKTLYQADQVDDLVKDIKR